MVGHIGIRHWQIPHRPAAVMVRRRRNVSCIRRESAGSVSSPLFVSLHEAALSGSKPVRCVQGGSLPRSLASLVQHHPA